MSLTPFHRPQTLCLGGPLHAVRVRMRKPGFTAYSLREGAHAYRRGACRHDQSCEPVYIHAALCDADALAAYLRLRGMA